MGSSRNRAKCSGWSKKKSSLSGGFVLTVESVADRDCLCRLDEIAASLDQQVERVANEDRIFLLLGNKQGVEKVLLLA